MAMVGRAVVIIVTSSAARNKAIHNENIMAAMVALDIFSACDGTCWISPPSFFSPSSLSEDSSDIGTLLDMWLRLTKASPDSECPEPGDGWLLSEEGTSSPSAAIVTLVFGG